MILTREQIQEMQEAARPLVEFLNKHGHPHTSVTVTQTSAEFNKSCASAVYPAAD